MEDIFDAISEQLGIKRKSAILTYCPGALLEQTEENEKLALALNLLAEIIRRDYPEIVDGLTDRLGKLNGPISTAADIAQTVLTTPQ